MQSISASQVPLPVIAPRPSAPEDYIGSGSMVGMAGPGIPAWDPYTPYGYSYENPRYELPPHLQHSFQPPAASPNMGQETYSPESIVPNSMGSYTRRNFANHAPGESDSGIDMNHPGLSSQSSTPSNPSVYASHGRYGKSPTVNSKSGPNVVDSSPRVMYPHPPRVTNPDHWRKPAQGGYQDPWSSTISPQPIDAVAQQNEGTANLINAGVRGSVVEGSGTYQARLSLTQESSPHDTVPESVIISSRSTC